MDEKIYWMALHSIKGVGPAMFHKILSLFQSPEAVFRLSDIELQQIPRLTNNMITEIRERYENLEEIERLYEDLMNNGINVLTIEDPEYPENLKALPHPPPLFYMINEINDSDQRAVAIVGTRKPSEKGAGIAEKLASKFAGNGLTVVSGFARGIDVAAHRGALLAGGRTILVLSFGIRHYKDDWLVQSNPIFFENRIVLSQYQINEPWSAGTAMERNKTVVGLSRSVVVVECSEKGGAMNAANRAIKLNIPLFAVEYQQWNEQNLGNHLLLNKGAVSIKCIEDYKKVVQIY